MVSLKDIAAKAGVSVATASKALRDQSDIGEVTKKKIKDIATEMGYMPNSAARALKTNESKNLGVLYIDESGYGFKHEHFAGVLEGFKERAENLGYDITFINTGESDNMTYLEHCRYRNFDGVIIVCAIFADPQVIELMESDLPVVTIDYVHDSCAAVTSNNTSGMMKLVDFAVSKGHKKIAYVHGQDYAMVTKTRIKTFKDRMKYHGLEVPAEYLKTAAYRETEGTKKCTEELLELADPPTCIFYPDDLAIIGGVQVIHSKGLKIKEDIGIAGFDGSNISMLISPQLTTVKQETLTIGNKAAELLVDLIADKENSQVDDAHRRYVREIVDVTLVEGESI